MATYYIDPANGSDSNNGLGPDASHASNKPWATIGKALGASGISSGDTVYLAPGTYREAVTVNMTSATAETKLLGDPSNVQGFKTSGGAAVAAGPVTWTGYTTNDKTAPSASSVLNLSGRDYLTFNNIFFVQGAAITVSATTTTSQYIVFRDCAFLSNPASAFNHFGINGVTGGGTPFEWTIDRCRFMTGRASCISVTVAQAASGTANNDVKFVVKNCLFIVMSNNAVINAAGTASTGDKPGGLIVRNCSFLGVAPSVQTSAAWSTTVPVNVANCVMITGNSTSLNANTSGQITESYNLISAGTPRANVTAGTGSISDGSYAALLHFGQELLWGGSLRPLGEPMASSPLLAFGNDGNQDTYDVLNRPKPAGGASATPAVGALERANTFVTDSSPIGSGSSAIKATGPAYHEFVVPVPARAITISCKVKWDATYAGTKPQLQLLANGRIGVSAETKTATGSSGGSGETLTLSAFTPTVAGDSVRVRVVSNDTNGAGVMQVDDFTVSG